MNLWPKPFLTHRYLSHFKSGDSGGLPSTHSSNKPSLNTYYMHTLWMPTICMFIGNTSCVVTFQTVRSCLSSGGKWLLDQRQWAQTILCSVWLMQTELGCTPVRSAPFRTWVSQKTLTQLLHACNPSSVEAGMSIHGASLTYWNKAKTSKRPYPKGTGQLSG